MLTGACNPTECPLHVFRAARRRLEFIGDSDTAGWCADGAPSTNDNADNYQDAYQTWAQHIARNVSADVMVEAVSGYGCVRCPSSPPYIHTHIHTPAPGLRVRPMG